eukprot:TRINITY_DN4208_c0_g1_i2.p1 TRINITY_DN4208_c0_g1~~TRINITY_DN4208_c0_g1_i2.p1  ORF type:complete len:349 (-),score=130.97 TRINITY_DN4208_c0_g1_i2:93-1139(-)
MVAAADMQCVREALLGGEKNQERQIIAVGLPHAVGTGTERHAYQLHFFDMAKDALEAAVKQADASVSTTKRKLEEAEAELSRRKDGIPALESAVKEAEEAEKAANTKLAAQRSEVSLRKKQKTTADHEFSSFEKCAGQAQKDADKVGAVMDLLKMLREGGWGDGDMRATSVAEVAKLLESVGVEDVLATAAPISLKRSPAERGPFDEAVVTGVVEALTQESEKVNAASNSATEAKDEARWEAMGLAALLEVTEDERNSADRVHRDAVSTVKQANTQLRRDEAGCTKQQEVILGIENDVKSFETAVTDRQKALEALERLKSPPAAAAVEEPPQPTAVEAISTPTLVAAA